MSDRLLRMFFAVAISFGAFFVFGCSPGAREASFLKRGKSYLEKHDYQRASLEFRSAQQLMPKDAEPSIAVLLVFHV